MLAKSLRPLVGDRVYQGLSRRPVFTGGQATEDIIRRMTQDQRLAERTTVTADAEWGHAEIPHDPGTRWHAATEYIDWVASRRQGRQRAVP